MGRGDKLPASLLRCDPAARKLLLTRKPFLVKDWDTTVPGAVTDGVVVDPPGQEGMRKQVLTIGQKY